MAFSKKTWKDRVSQYINRRLLTDSDGNTQQVTVTRDEGSVTEAGDAFSASNMNDLENRIEAAIPVKIQDLDNVNLTTSDNNKLLGVSVSDGDISVGAVDNGCSFSESEMLVGEWINGKPLYKKVIKLLSKTIPSGSITESLSSLGATMAFFDHCIMKDNYGNYVALPYISNTANTDISCYISANFSTLYITHGSYWENKTCDFYITFLYTKT